MLHLPGLGRMVLVALETAGPDPGTAASSLHPGPDPLVRFVAERHRTRESDPGGIGPLLSSACSGPIFPGDRQCHPVLPHLCHAQGVSLHGTPQDGR